MSQRWVSKEIMTTKKSCGRQGHHLPVGCRWWDREWLTVLSSCCLDEHLPPGETGLGSFCLSLVCAHEEAALGSRDESTPSHRACPQRHSRSGGLCWGAGCPWEGRGQAGQVAGQSSAQNSCCSEMDSCFEGNKGLPREDAVRIRQVFLRWYFTSCAGK